jgi:hypothetical protein
MEVSGRETSLAVFGTDFGGDSLSAIAVKRKNDVNQKRSIDRNTINYAAQATCRTHRFG